jgi:hypothetical protein
VYIFPSTNGFTHYIISIINQFIHTIYSGPALSQLDPTLYLLSTVQNSSLSSVIKVRFTFFQTNARERLCRRLYKGLLSSWMSVWFMAFGP